MPDKELYWDTLYHRAKPNELSAAIDLGEIRTEAELDMLESHAWGPLAANRESSDSSQSSEYLRHMNPWTISSVLSILLDIQEQSNCLFLGTFVFSRRVVYNQAYSNFFPSLIEILTRIPVLLRHSEPRQKPSSRTIGLQNLYSQSSGETQFALQQMNAILRDPNEQPKDETLIAVWFLTSFGMLTGYSMSCRTPGLANLAPMGL